MPVARPDGLPGEKPPPVDGEHGNSAHAVSSPQLHLREPDQRNVAVALGNWGSPDTVPALAIALNDEEALIRGHAAWALGRIGTEAARQALSGRAEVEEDAWVREEIAAAPW